MTQQERDEARLVRDAEIARRWLAGEPQERLARCFGLTPSAVCRILARVGARWERERIMARDAAEAAQRGDRVRRPRRKTGRKPVWADCPAHLHAEYLKIRPMIGSALAKTQLLELDARERGSVAQ